MIRTLVLFAALPPLTVGCIVYEDRSAPCAPGDDCPPPEDAEPRDPEPRDPRPEPEPEPEPEPQITDDLMLTVNQGEPGETLLSLLIPLDPELDLSGVVSVAFERDIRIIDT